MWNACSWYRWPSCTAPNWPPTRLLFSITVTEQPAWSNRSAADIPAMPAPMMVTEGFDSGMACLLVGEERWPRPGGLEYYSTVGQTSEGVRDGRQRIYLEKDGH